MPTAQAVRSVSRGTAAAPNLMPQPAGIAAPASNTAFAPTYDFCDRPNFVLIKYRGPTGKHVVFSPGRYVKNYSMRTNGDLFCVHFGDVEAAPHLFELVKPPAPAPEPEPVADLGAASETAPDVVAGDETPVAGTEVDGTTEGPLAVEPAAAPRGRGRPRKSKQPTEDTEEVEDEDEI